MRWYQKKFFKKLTFLRGSIGKNFLYIFFSGLGFWGLKKPKTVYCQPLYKFTLRVNTIKSKNKNKKSVFINIASNEAANCMAYDKDSDEFIEYFLCDYISISFIWKLNTIFHYNKRIT